MGCSILRAHTETAVAGAYDKGYAAGLQALAFETYAPNILHSLTLTVDCPEPERVFAELEHALRHRTRWAQ